jgi:hypothetical protein
MTEQAPRTEPLVGGKEEEVPCHFRGCERPAAPEAVGALEVRREHWAAMDASSEVEAWGVALDVLKPWVQTTEAIGFDDKLAEVMERALAEAEAAADLARDELERAEAAL